MDELIVAAVEVSQLMIARVRSHVVEQGLEAALNRRPPICNYQRKLDGAHEDHVIALACDTPPKGQGRWSLRLLADKLVALEGVETVSCQTVRHVLKANALKPWLRKQWCIPRQANGAFVWRMEDVLDVNTRPYDPRRPLVCMDEVSKQLLRDTRVPQPPTPRRPTRVDYEYECGGVANCILFCNPLQGQRWVDVRWVDVTLHRTKRDWAVQIRELVDLRYPDVVRIVLVLDTRNTHTPAALYDAFAPAEAKRLADKLGIHYTPKYGSWLNIAEIELSVLSCQCLDQRVPDFETLAREVAAWQERRNMAARAVDCRFTTEDTRIKLKRLYPSLLGGT